MPCRAVPCHAVPCHAVPCHALPFPALPFPAMPCHAMPCHAIPCRAVPCHAVPCHAVPCRAMPCRAVPCRAVPCRAMPRHAMLCPAQFVHPAGTVVREYEAVVNLAHWNTWQFYHGLVELLPLFLALHALRPHIQGLPVALQLLQVEFMEQVGSFVLGLDSIDLNARVIPNDQLFFARRLYQPLYTWCGHPSPSLWHRLRHNHLLPPNGLPMMRPDWSLVRRPASSLTQPAVSYPLSPPSDWVVVVARRMGTRTLEGFDEMLQGVRGVVEGARGAEAGNAVGRVVVFDGSLDISAGTSNGPERTLRICRHCKLKFVGGAFRCAQHITCWKGLKRKDVRLCNAPIPSADRGAVRELYEGKHARREGKKKAEEMAIEACVGGAKKQCIEDFYGEGASCAKESADDAICLMWAALHLPEHLADRRGASRLPYPRNTGGYIASVLRPIIEKVGPANIVALCMDGGSNYAAACRELMLEYPHIEHVPCATHVMDLLMEDIGEMDWAKDIVAKAGVIITFVRAHHFTKGYMRSPQVKGGKGKQVLKPAGTRFGTQFIAVQRLCEVRSALTQMVLSPQWQAWAKGRKPPVEPFATMIMDAVWWKGAEFFVALLKIPFVVMCKTDSTAKGMMGRMYDLMLQLTEDINAKLEEEEAGLVLSSSERTEVTNIVQKRWDHSMACAMHVVGRILNPVNQEEGIFRTDLECTRVFKAFVARHYAGRTVTRKEGEELRASHVIQDGLTAFNTLQGSFGLPDAISDHELVKAGKKTAVQWWTWHGTEHPELTTLACRVLSQPVSASACERNWAVWESIHTAKRNRLGSEKCRDLVYVVHNWNIVRNWHKGAEGVTVLPGNIPEASLPEGYNEPHQHHLPPFPFHFPYSKPWISFFPFPTRPSLAPLGGTAHRLFRRALLFIGVHGAALTNLIFMPHNATLLELRPIGMANACYHHLSSVCTVQYYLLLCDGGKDTPVTCHMDHLMAAVEEAWRAVEETFGL
ncbi:unnamed protein product [Closterium sp. NIES-53]